MWELNLFENIRTSVWPWLHDSPLANSDPYGIIKDRSRLRSISIRKGTGISFLQSGQSEAINRLYKPIRKRRALVPTDLVYKGNYEQILSSGRTRRIYASGSPSSRLDNKALQAATSLSYYLRHFQLDEKE